MIRHEEVRTSSGDGLLGSSGNSSGADRLRRSAFDADLGVGPNGPASVASVGTVDLGFGPENLDNFGDLPSVGSLSAERAPLLLDFDAPGSIHADQFGDEMFGGLLSVLFILTLEHSLHSFEFCHTLWTLPLFLLCR